MTDGQTPDPPMALDSVPGLDPTLLYATHSDRVICSATEDRQETHLSADPLGRTTGEAPAHAT